MADLAQIAGDVAGKAASGPISGIAAILDAAKGIIGQFVTDPDKKLAASQHLVDLQYQLQMAQLDAQSKDVASSASANANASVGKIRAFFGCGMTTLYLWNYGVGPAFHYHPVDIPMNLNLIFAAMMLGFIGVPAAIETLEKVMGMPGDSSVKLMGVQVSNKS